MATKIRSSDGCWTCRLRRKKCDEHRPICISCATLEIDCLYSEVKPDWMDGGEQQKERAEILKAEVKRHAGYRREKRYMQGIEDGLGELEMAEDNVDDSQVPDSEARDRSSTDSGRDFSSIASATPPESVSNISSNAPEPHDHHSELRWQAMGNLITPRSYLAASSPGTPTSIATLSFEERELTMAMLYLDYVFPFLFPFYRPPLIDSGRGWLLVLLSRNKALFHTALSLASYFFSVSLKNVSGVHDTCKVHNAEELEKQQDLALRELQHDMAALNRRGYKTSLVDTSRVMASIVQLMNFEVAVFNNGNRWQIHLDAASELFGQIIDFDGSSEPHGPLGWSGVLEMLGPRFIHVKGQRQPWISDQASLRFFTATLLFADVLGSTSLEQAPRLQRWHQHLLTPCEEVEEQGEAHIQLERFVGVQNWVVIAIGEIAALAAWKKEMKKANSLSITQLVSRASAIEKMVRSRTFAMSKPGQPGDASHGALDSLIQYHPHMLDGHAPPRVTNTHTLIWAQAALTYLNVVVSGWQPGSQEIRESVDITLHTFAQIVDPAVIRLMSWPFCVTGCLAAPDQEHLFREMVMQLGTLQAFGTIREALVIMEQVWSNRASIEQNADSWDLASCFRCLGHASLLM